MRHQSRAALFALVAMLSGCGGSGGGGTAPTGSGAVAGTPTPAPAPTSGSCSLRARQDWAFQQINEWYLFPENLPASLNPSPFTSVQAYIDALTATARGLRRDRFFTFITSIAEENAFLASGSSAGFGVRLATDTTARRVLIAEAFEGAPALAAGIDRGTEILAIGTSPSDIRTVDTIITAEGSAGISTALGPSTAGLTRLLRVRTAGVTRDINVTKADFTLNAVSARYGAQIINDDGRRVGYINLRTFISTADQALRDAFTNFRAQGITDIIIDLRYNGGGLVSTAELLSDLMGRNRTASEVQRFTTFRTSKSSENSTKFFATQPQSIAPTRIAFIGTVVSASASESVINSFIPYLGTSAALIGTNTFGKPVGQIGLDRAACDDRLRVTAFAGQNADRQGAYFDGLAGTVRASCQATDDVTRQLGDPQEASTRQALDFLAGRSCTPINPAPVSSAPVATSRGQNASVNVAASARELLTPAAPNVPQREVPGLF